MRWRYDGDVMRYKWTNVECVEMSDRFDTIWMSERIVYCDQIGYGQ